MKRHGYVEGTTGITYVHKKDARRHRKHCKHYFSDGSCSYMSKCCGSAQCMFYEEEEQKTGVGRNMTVPQRECKRSNENTIIEVKNNEKVEPFSGTRNIRISDIVIPKKYLRMKPDAEKVKAIEDYYQEHKRMDKPIYVSISYGKYILEDKYLRYYVAKELGKTWIKARFGTYEESIAGDRLLEVGRRVHHKKYGDGPIVLSDGKYVVVSFDGIKEVRFDFEVCVKKNLLR